jgi:excisionase family DNA binding protein
MKLLKRLEAAKLLTVSLRTFDGLVLTGDIPVVRIGRAVRIKPEAIDRFIEASETRMKPWKRRGVRKGGK